MVNAATRVHVAEWLIGEVAGLLASFALRTKYTPTEIHAQRDQCVAFQAMLKANKIPLDWGDAILQERIALLNRT